MSVVCPVLAVVKGIFQRSAIFLNNKLTLTLYLTVNDTIDVTNFE